MMDSPAPVRIFCTRKQYADLTGLAPEADAVGAQICGTNGAVIIEYVFVDDPGLIADVQELERMYGL